MWKRFFAGIYLDAIALNPRFAAFPFVGVHFMAFWISCGESDGFPFRRKEYPV